MNVLINLKSCEVIAKSKNLKVLEYLAEIKCSNDPFYICGDEKRWLSKFTLMELGLIYKGLFGSKLEITDYKKALELVHQEILSLDEWTQTEEELRVVLGRDLEPESPLPVKEPRKMQDRSTSKVRTSKLKHERPKEGSVTGKVWDICDQLTEQLGEMVPRAQAKEECVKQGINPSTASTQYSKWRDSNF